MITTTPLLITSTTTTITTTRNSEDGLSPCQMPTVFVHVHLVGLVVVELLPDGGLVLRR